MFYIYATWGHHLLVLKVEREPGQGQTWKWRKSQDPRPGPCRHDTVHAPPLMIYLLAIHFPVARNPSRCQSEGTSESEGLPGVGRSWRDTLLLQALRETGEEMKRRRQTHREVRARHAAEEEAAAMCGGGGAKGSSSSSSSAATATYSQPGGEGRWKPTLSRQEDLSLAALPRVVGGIGSPSRRRGGAFTV